MFSPAAMVRLSALVLGRHERPALSSLGQLGAVQFTRPMPGLASVPLPTRDHQPDLARCDRLVSRIAELQRTLEIAARPTVATPALTFDSAEEQVARWEERTRAWAQQREQTQRRLGEVNARLKQLTPFRTLSVPLSQLRTSPFLHCFTGSFPSGGLERWPRQENGVLLPLPAQAGCQPVIALATPRQQKMLEASLKASNFRFEELPAVAGVSPQQMCEDAEREQGQLQAALRELDQEGQALARAAAQPLAELQQWATVERRLNEADGLFPRTANVVLLTGWVPAAETDAVQSELRTSTQGSCVVEIRAADEVAELEVPVLLRQPSWLRPFVILVTAFGFPRYRELVPTLVVAVSYVLMFGMMFGDVGHGGLLALAGAALLTFRRQGGGRDIGVLLLVNGLSSACFGLVYGSYFGLPGLKHHAWWHDPIEGDPMSLMLLAMGLGVVLMSVGLGLNIMNRFRRGEWVEGALDKFGIAGVVFYWGALLLSLRAAALQASGWWRAALILFLGVPILAWIIKEPLRAAAHRKAGKHAENETVGALVAESLVGAFEGVLLYLANTISFVRLAAYAMSHAALLMATFTLADQVRTLGAIGPVLGVLVIILGNVTAMVLEGIVAAVQALRLEYYEFFGKFFSGDGQPFKPFSLVPDRRV